MTKQEAVHQVEHKYSELIGMRVVLSVAAVRVASAEDLRFLANLSSTTLRDQVRAVLGPNSVLRVTA